MKKLFIGILLGIFCATSYSQDSTKRKVKQKTEDTKKKIKTKAKDVNDDLDNKADSAVKKVFPKAHKI